jgi:hypothetical protein
MPMQNPFGLRIDHGFAAQVVARARLVHGSHRVVGRLRKRCGGRENQHGIRADHGLSSAGVATLALNRDAGEFASGERPTA